MSTPLGLGGSLVFGKGVFAKADTTEDACMSTPLGLGGSLVFGKGALLDVMGSAIV